MATYPPGNWPRNALCAIEVNTLIAIPQARAYRRAKVAFQNVGKELKTVDRYSAYRTAELQNAMHDAGLSPYGSAVRKKYSLASYSTVAIAAHPYGSHEDARCIDVLINGSDDPSQASIDLLAKYGWIQQFGARDRNHFRHDNIHALTPVTVQWCLDHHLYVYGH
jgi:hypothetical protein